MKVNIGTQKTLDAQTLPVETLIQTSNDGVYMVGKYSSDGSKCYIHLNTGKVYNIHSWTIEPNQVINQTVNLEPEGQK